MKRAYFQSRIEVNTLALYGHKLNGFALFKSVSLSLFNQHCAETAHITSEQLTTAAVVQLTTSKTTFYGRGQKCRILHLVHKQY